MLYQTTFTYEKNESTLLIELDLGQVYEIAEVILNENRLNVVLWEPYTLDITNIIQNGSNTLCIEVKNTVSNQICNLSRSSGLVGPVLIKAYSI